MKIENLELWQVDKTQIKEYDKIPMLIHVKSILKLRKVNNGLGGFSFTESPTKEYMKDLAQYSNRAKTIEYFDAKNWAIFMAYANKMPVGGAIVASRTEEVDLLDGRDDLAVLWDLRVNDRYQRKGVGQQLLSKAIDWATENNLTQMKIECQNNNVKACNFYAKNGAVLSQVNEYAYYKEKELRDEIQLIWYLNLK